MSNDAITPAYKPPSGPADVEHQTKEWTSGTRGGGKVPADFEWKSNPKVQQEENGSNRAEGTPDKKP